MFIDHVHDMKKHEKHRLVWRQKREEKESTSEDASESI
jgi:hypothetical protein